MQSDEAFEPDKARYVPAIQFEHLLAPELPLKLPAGQLTQLEEPVFD